MMVGVVMATIEEINKELELTGGERKVLPVIEVNKEIRRVRLGPPYNWLSVSMNSIIGDVDNIKAGDEIILNTLIDGKTLREKYYLLDKSEQLKDVL